MAQAASLFGELERHGKLASVAELLGRSGAHARQLAASIEDNDDKKWAVVKNLQKLLVRSRSACLVAVRRVTQLNQGRYTAGIDGKTYVTGALRMQLVEETSQLDPDKYRC